MTHHDVIIFKKLKLKKNPKTNNCKKNFEILLNPTKDINITRFTCLRFARQVSPPYRERVFAFFSCLCEDAYLELCYRLESNINTASHYDAIVYRLRKRWATWSLFISKHTKAWSNKANRHLTKFNFIVTPNITIILLDLYLSYDVKHCENNKQYICDRDKNLNLWHVQSSWFVSRMVK